MEALKWGFEVIHQPIGGADIDKVIYEIGLADSANIRCSDLSLGQKKRVAIAPFCRGQNPLWIMDEPFSSLDGIGINLLYELFQKRSASGGLIIFSSHQEIPAGLEVKKLELR